jgi:hypothetical protein
MIRVKTEEKQRIVLSVLRGEARGPNFNGKGSVLIEHWDGTRWSEQPAPAPQNAASSDLANVACASPTRCVAVGSYRNSRDTWLPLVEAWDGTTWSEQSVSLPAGVTGGTLAGVSCVSGPACVAVGAIRTPGVYAAGGLTETSGGIRWTPHASQRGVDFFRIL